MRLTIRESRTAADSGREIWPVPDVPRHFIEENRTYYIDATGPATAESLDLLVDDEILEALRPPPGTIARWRWSPGFYSGSAECEYRVGRSKRVRFSLASDPDAAKLTRDAFDRMLLDILDDSGVLFSLSAFRVSLGRGTGDLVPPLARLEFLRSRLRELEQILTAIDRRPVRALARHSHFTRIDAVRVLDEGLFRRSMHSGEIGQTETGDYLPRYVHTTKRVASTDIQENRFIRVFLSSMSAWLAVVAERLTTIRSGDPERDTVHRRWGRRCRQMAARLNALAELPTFKEARGNSTLRSPVSPVFSRRPDYLRFQKVYNDLQRGLSQVYGDFLEMPLARTFDLYELWAYLRLVRASMWRFGSKVEVDELFEPERSATGVAVFRKRATVRIGHVALTFQREYHEFWLEKSGLGSFSRTMIPDIAVASETPLAIVVFDAKYRIGSDINDAIASLHMYRDALVTSGAGLDRVVAGAYILTPDRYDTPGSWTEFKVPRLLFHPGYRGSFRFGALTLRPGMSLDDCASVVELAFRDAGIPLPA